MVGAWQPEYFFAAHPLKPNHNILKRDKNRVADMKGPVGVRRRHYNGEGFFSRSRQLVRIKKTGLFPELVDFILYFFRFVNLWKFHIVLL